MIPNNDNESGPSTCHIPAQVPDLSESDDEIDEAETWTPSNAKYYDPQSFVEHVAGKYDKSHNFSLLHLNADNINTKLESFIIFINGQMGKSNFAWDVIAILETHCKRDPRNPWPRCWKCPTRIPVFGECKDRSQKG